MARPERLRIPLLGGVSVPDNYAAWLAAAEAVSSPTAALKTAMLALYQGLIDTGLWDLWEGTDSFFYNCLGTNPADTDNERYALATINLISPGTFDATAFNQNNPGLADDGIAGDGAMYWTTGLNATTHIGAGRFGNFAMGMTISGPEEVVALNVSEMGMSHGWNGPVAKWGDDNYYAQLNNQLLTTPSASGNGGLFSVSSQGGNIKQYLADVEQATVALGAQSTLNFDLLCFARRDGGSGLPAAHSTRRHGVFFAVPGMTGAQIADLYELLVALHVAFGSNI